MNVYKDELRPFSDFDGLFVLFNLNVAVRVQLHSQVYENDR